ncbi:DUF3800 domain-containing protein [Candidatus Saccharibacteria bacterium]|nr:DUF3800 domain-containing protein [Candidatus Saccharibacteria bacterium]
MVKVYIDESGNMGRAGNYFVLAAVVVKGPKGEGRLKRLVRREQRLDAEGRRLEAEKWRKELKFSKMKFPQRQRLIHELAEEEGAEMFYFVAYKPRVSLLMEGKEKNLIYNYFSKLLMSKIFKRYDEDFEIIFDQRSTAVKSMNSLTDYIEISAYAEYPNLVGKKVTVNQADSRTNLLLQVADVVAGAGAQAYSLRNRHFLEILGERIRAIYEFPRRGFQGSLKFMIGKLKLIDVLRGF